MSSMAAFIPVAVAALRAPMTLAPRAIAFGSRAASARMDGGIVEAAGLTLAASPDFASLAETAASAAAPNEFVSPLMVFGGVTAGLGLLILVVNLLVSFLMGGSDASTTLDTPERASSPGDMQAPDTTPRAGFLRRDASAILSKGLSNVLNAPTGWLFGDKSPLYSNVPEPVAAAEPRMGAREAARNASPAAAKPKLAYKGAAAPSPKPFGGRYAAPVAPPPADAAPLMAGRPVAQSTAFAVAPVAAVAVPVAVATATATPVVKAAAAPVAKAVAVPVVPVAAATPVVKAAAAPVAKAVAVPVVPVAKVAAVPVVPVAKAAAPTPVAVAKPAAPVRPAPPAPAPAAAAAAPAPAPAAAGPDAMVVLTERVSELSERNNALVEMMSELKREVAALKEGK